MILNSIGYVYNALNKKEKALVYYEKALPIFEALRNWTGEAATLNNIGLMYSDLGEKEKALGYYEKALQVIRTIGNLKGEATTLRNIGGIYFALDDKKKALDYYEKSLPISRAVGDRSGEACTINAIGGVYDSLGEKAKALSNYENVLQIIRNIGNRDGEATTLNNIGSVYYTLGEKEKALGYYEQALSIHRAMGNRDGEATTLNNIGGIYSALGETEKALDYYEKALSLFTALGDHAHEISVLCNLVGLSTHFGEQEKALGYYEAILPLHRAVGDRGGEARTLNNIGVSFFKLGEQKKALNYYEKALPIFVALGDPPSEAVTFSNLMLSWKALNNKQMAIFYGKLAVNGYQQLRENIAIVDKEIKHSYLKTKKNAYRYLIDILIDQRRLDEALLVLDMLKAEEYYRFIQKDSSSSLPDRQYQPLEFTPFEQQWVQKFNTITANITTVSSQYHELLMAKPKNEAERNRLTQLEIQLKEANKTYDQLLLQLKGAFTEYDQKVKKGEYEALNLAEKPNSIQSILRDLDKTEGGKNVTLHYFIFDNKIQIILTTPSSQTVQSSSIDEEKLNNMIGKYQAAINYTRSRGVALLPQPTNETAPLTSTELYDLIFKPIDKDLKNYDATNLMVYLDGVLRYIPLPVLFDGQNYLVQRFRISVLTTSSLLSIKDEPVQKLKILGMAAGKGGSDISALPNARAEIRSIVRDTSSGCSGFIDGKALVDEAFTKTTMFQQLKTFSFPLVHIASHFNFSSENETQNYLMLGDSSKLTLKDIRLEGNLFHNVEMLVLAACQTAMGSSSGVEIDSFGELAQKSGAKSVVASLWIVNDKSSKDLMVSFYRDIKDHRFSSKIEAMRQAQLKLAGLDDLMQTNKQPKREKTPYASPYYWGPFIMMGNWR